MTQSPHDTLLIIDFGSQVTQLIARRLRELSVYCEIHPYQNVTMDLVTALAPKAIIFSGGPDSVVREGSPRPPEGIFDYGVPILGICYGQQVMMQDLGGLVEGGKISGGGGTAAQLTIGLPSASASASASATVAVAVDCISCVPE